MDAGLPYHDRTVIESIESGPPWKLIGRREGEAVEITARFLVDASGAGGALDGNNDTIPCRIDVLYGSALWYDDLACRLTN